MGDSDGAGRSRRASDWSETPRLRSLAGVGGRAGRKVSGLPLLGGGGTALGTLPPPPKDSSSQETATATVCVCVCLRPEAQAPGRHCPSAAAGSHAAPRESGPAAGGGGWGGGGGGPGFMRHQLGPAALEGGIRPGTQGS